MEFKLSTDLTNVSPQTIDFNYDELKKTIQTGLEPYKNLVITEENIATGAKYKANINNLEKAIDNEKKRIKSIVIAPYVEFENKCKELMGLCKEASAHIGTQLNDFEEKRKEEKKEFLRGKFNELADGQTLISFDDVFAETWLNKGTKVSQVVEEIQTALTKTESEVSAIKNLESDYETELLLFYNECRDLTKVLERNKRLKEQSNIPKTPKPTPIVEAEAIEDEPEYTLAFSITATRRQIDNLKVYLTQSNIKFEKYKGE